MTRYRTRRASAGRLVCVGAVLLTLVCYSVPVIGAQDGQPSHTGPPTPEPGEWTLDRVVAAALAQHPLVEAAQARLDAARGDRVTAGALPNPVATYWVENARFPGQGTLAGLSRESSAYVTLPLEPFFQRPSRIRQADEEVKTADASLALARRQVATEAVHAFYRVALAQASVDAAEENRAGLEQLGTYNRARVKEGVTAEADLIRVEVEIDRAATEVALAEAELARFRAELQPFLGEVSTQVSTVSTIRVRVPAAAAAESPGIAIPAFDVVTARARDKRPELVANRARSAAAAAAVDYERTLSVRQIGATFGMKRTEGQNSMIAAVGVAIPLFDRNRGGVQRATGERVAAERELAWTERTVTAEVQGAYASAQRLSRQVAAYQESGASLLQVLDATRTLAEARLTYSRALLAQRQSLFDLALSSGADPGDALDTLRSWNASSGGATHQGGGQ